VSSPKRSQQDRVSLPRPKGQTFHHGPFAVILVSSCDLNTLTVSLPTCYTDFVLHSFTVRIAV